MNNKIKGNEGEKIAQEYLQTHGFKILDTNFRFSRVSEIDIIAQKNNTLHFIEVKTRSGNFFGTPFEAITKSKLNSIYSCSKHYLSTTNIRYDGVQIDAIGVILKRDGKHEIQFLENISLN